MSFILDALKKSENERNRQAGPALLEVRVAPRRARLPLWAIVILLALGLNLVVIGYLLLRGRPATPAAIPAAVALPAAPVATPPAVRTAVAQPAATPAALADPALAMTPLPPAAADPISNPADFAPALPRSVGAPASTGTVAQGAVDLGLPSLNDLNAGGANLPELHLSLHVYDPDPARRYVLLNSTRLREGETTPDGIRLERVTETGVVLSWRSRRFTIQRGE